MFVNLGSFAHMGGIEWVRRGLQHVPPDDARLLARRWGLDGGPPCSIAELAREEGISPIAMVRRLQEAERHLLRAMGAARPPASQGAGPGSPPRPSSPARSAGTPDALIVPQDSRPAPQAARPAAHAAPQAAPSSRGADPARPAGRPNRPRSPSHPDRPA